MTQGYKKLEADMLSLTNSLSGILTRGEVAEVEMFIGVGEYGVALETLCAILKESQRTISASASGQIEQLARQMGIDTGNMRVLGELAARADPADPTPR